MSSSWAYFEIRKLKIGQTKLTRSGDLKKQ
jgi:hypothetical protein